MGLYGVRMGCVCVCVVGMRNVRESVPGKNDKLIIEESVRKISQVKREKMFLIETQGWGSKKKGITLPMN